MGPEKIYIFKAFDTLSKIVPGKVYRGLFNHRLPQSLASIQQTLTQVGGAPFLLSTVVQWCSWDPARSALATWLCPILGCVTLEKSRRIPGLPFPPPVPTISPTSKFIATITWEARFERALRPEQIDGTYCQHEGYFSCGILIILFLHRTLFARRLLIRFS